ncbi:RIP metalloprotease RseP [Paenibacillus abyssi]|uniref:Zinc metalloprotease n=1 Tax=Paenibacillus abyssi TaxID=1340531 RepID=A0A917D7V8_9BACL|nr:RIP metalloprotease RseP [Paenibacillus abyssi]GGG12108.1 zinc metalloprotease [Paenibacillus abyssi]
MELVQNILLTVLVFFVIVSIHEWGHFYFAKRAGILVREFAIGFGPKLFSLKKGETRYTLRLIPAGGFVRMAGEDPELVEVQPGQTIAVRLEGNQVTKIYLDRLDERSNVIRGEVEAIDLEKTLKLSLNIEGDQDHYDVHPQAMMITKGKEVQIAPLDRQFGSKTVGQRALAIFAGPMMNFVLAFVLFAAYIQMAGVPIDPPQKVMVGEIIPDRPASKANLKVDDEIKTINGVEIGGDYNKMIELISSSPNVLMKWTVVREGQLINLEITPIPDPDSDSGDGKVGIAPKFPTRSASFTETFKFAGQAMKNMTINIFEGFKMLIFGQFALDDLGGPVRTAEMTSEIASRGIAQLTSWTAILSLYLGIFNLLPFPALDGSRLIFLGVEALRGRPVDPNRESMVHFIGFAMLMLLMIAVTYNDILRLVRG